MKRRSFLKALLAAPAALVALVKGKAEGGTGAGVPAGLPGGPYKPGEIVAVPKRYGKSLYEMCEELDASIREQLAARRNVK